MTGPAVRLLGPVQIVSAGEPLALGPSRQRSVLAVLLLALGRPVCVGDLITRVWGDEPPPAAEQALRTYLSRLRRIVENSAIRIERRDGGYAAVVEQGELDVVLVRQLATRALVAVRDGRLRDARTDLDRATGHVRGVALTGVGSAWLDEQRRLLEREQLAVALDRNDLALATGTPGQVVADALARLTDEPYDERIAGQAVLGLAAVGRTAEALQVFESVRRRLADELGIDPGPALREVHDRVLRGLVGVGPPGVREVAAPAAGAPPVPRQLPPATRGFVDRTAESLALDRLLLHDDEPAVVVLSGPGGAGKSALAVHWAHQHCEHYPDGQLYLDLHGFDPDHRPTTSEAALRALLTALGVDRGAIPPDLAGMVGAYRSLLAGRRVLLLVDDAGSAEHVRLLLPPGRGSAALVTSRSGLAGLATTAAAQVLVVALFDDLAARELLTRRLGAARTDAEPVAVERLVTHCGGLPLALAITAGRAAAMPSLTLSSLADELDDESRRLSALSGGDRRADLDAAVASSVAALTSPARSLLQWLAAGPRIGVRTQVAAALAGVTEPEAVPILRELLAIHLIEPDRGRFRLHDLVRLAVRSRPAPGLDEAVDRLLEFMITECSDAERSGTAAPVDDLATAAAYASETGRDPAHCDLADALTGPLGSAGRWSDLVALHESAYRSADRLDDDRRRATALIGRGRGRIGLREFAAAEADLTTALELSDRLGDLAVQARAHRALARLAAHQQRWGMALDHDESGLAVHRRRGDVVGEAHARNAIGWHLAHLGRASEGLVSCRRALDMFVAADVRTGQALTLDSIGYALDRLGRPAEARDAYRRAVELCRELGWQVVLANTLMRLAETAAALGDDHEAATVRTEAEEILRLSGRHILEPGHHGSRRSPVRQAGPVPAVLARAQ